MEGYRPFKEEYAELIWSYQIILLLDGLKLKNTLRLPLIHK
jgi:hypothetical protein